MRVEWSSFWDYVNLGVEHIWTGYDHLLFLLAVMIGTGKPAHYIQILTAFTIGHSLTLALASLDLVSLPSSIIEPLIALSIVVVSLESLFRPALAGRWRLTLPFGLIHGFGFAGVLQGFTSSNFALALFSFNLGVEIGQLAVLLIILPVLHYLLRQTTRKEWFKHALALVTGIFGLVWLVERTIF
ncbi:HupE/UreJ family protein [Paenibacillus aurantius]|uniref:HupE/UreJ family protein n=1 Tax=Paenibacillus aurantius TaxID=2918900 RepID=A0AA96RFD8_9BACL|nr:HupE/UreJ family protein [Paenibacillus aurantius]WNQ08834.1 HupE/UreJ family protein [Paenibacillus aurantius]